MNILIVTQYFHPENFRINDLAVEFQKRGHEITVLTGVPNYPKGRFYKGYGIFKRNRERFKGIEIYRAPCLPRGSGSYLKLMLSYLSYVIGAMCTSLFMLRNKYDIIFVHEPSPITVCLPAIFIKKIKRIPICFWVLDLWPESVKHGANLKSDLIPRMLMPLVRYIYRNCDKILVSSRGFIKSIVEKGVEQKKVEYFPQWSESLFKPTTIKDNLLTKQVPRNSFKIMFAGNIGEAQDFVSILEAAEKLKLKKNIHWVILGSGSKESWVKEQIKLRGLSNNFHMMGSFPLVDMPEFYSEASAMLISLKKADIYSVTVPAKLQTYFASGKPVLGMVDGETAEIINEAKAGLTCDAETPLELSENISIMSEMDQAELTQMGKCGLEYHSNNFKRSILFNKMLGIFRDLVNIK